MSGYNVVVMPSAKRDIADAARYISDDLCNKSAASRYLDFCQKALSLLKDMPLRHPISDLDILRDRDLRTVPIGNYVAIYRVYESEHRVEVYRVLYSRMNLSDKMRED